MERYVIDIIIAIPIVWAAYKGYNQGVWVQLGGIVGVILGAWIGFHFGSQIGEMLNLTGQAAYIAGFVTAIIAVLICVAVLSNLIKGLFRVSGLSIIDHIGGVALALCKIVIILALIIALFDELNAKYNWVERKNIENSYIYTPMKNTADVIFPFAKSVKEILFNTQNETK